MPEQKTPVNLMKEESLRQKTPPSVLLAYGFLLIFLAFSAAVNQAARKQLGPLEVDAILPDLVVNDLSGGEVKLSQLVGGKDVALISVWASWCVSCKLEVPVLQKLREQENQQKVAMIFLSVDEDLDKLRSYLSLHPLPFPVYRISFEALHQNLRIESIPWNVVIDSQWKILVSDSKPPFTVLGWLKQ